uniref:hypothetical protein n=1 Tax=Prevotella sp. TaxID=59823 RepID=UPI00402A30DA
MSLANARSGVPEPAIDTVIITFADAASHLQTCFLSPTVIRLCPTPFERQPCASGRPLPLAP